MDFEDALAYVQGRLRLGWKLGNDRFLALLGRLGNPQDSLRAVHIAGTKGKGSTAVIAASILQAAGHRTGVYLSPYVYDVRERIQIDGEMIPKADFARWVEIIRPHVEALELTELGATTEFELKTAIGFCHFAASGVDYAVVEVGLGGRLDATNVLRAPLATAITSIGYDHVEILGPTLSDIAREKAGIVKSGIPCVTAVPEGSEPYLMIERICAERGAPLLRVASAASFPEGADNTPEGRRSNAASPPSPPRSGKGSLRNDDDSSPSRFGRGGEERAGVGSEVSYWTGADGSLSIRTPVRTIDGIRMQLIGAFQHANAATAVGLLDAIDRDARPLIADDAVRAGLEKAYLPGRLEKIADRPLVVVDGAHNELSARALAAALRELAHDTSDANADGYEPRRLILTVGLSRNHAPGPFLEPLLALHPAAVVATQPAFHPRDAHEVAAVAADAKIDQIRVVASSAVDACREALALAGDNDIVCLTGSFYTIGDVPPETWRILLQERN